MRPTTTTAAISKWWKAKSELFSKLGDGDEFTNGQVVVAHAVMIVFIVLCMLLSSMEGGAV